VSHCLSSEQAGIDGHEAGCGERRAAHIGGEHEGKETRFGISGRLCFATVTTDAVAGAVNSMHDSYTPIGGLVPLFNLQTDEVIFGGVGAGLYGMLMYAIVGVFIAASWSDGRRSTSARDPAEGSKDGALRHPGHVVPDSGGSASALPCRSRREAIGIQRGPASPISTMPARTA